MTVVVTVVLLCVPFRVIAMLVPAVMTARLGDVAVALFRSSGSGPAASETPLEHGTMTSGAWP